MAETDAPGAVFALVARRHEISRGQLWKWRGQVLRSELAPVAMVPEFIPGQVTANAVAMPQTAGKLTSVNGADSDLAPPPRSSRSKASQIDILLPDGICVWVNDGGPVLTLPTQPENQPARNGFAMRSRFLMSRLPCRSSDQRVSQSA